MHTIMELAYMLQKYDQEHTSFAHPVREYERGLRFLIESPLSLEEIRESCLSSKVDEEHTQRVIDVVEYERKELEDMREYSRKWWRKVDRLLAREARERADNRSAIGAIESILACIDRFCPRPHAPEMLVDLAHPNELGAIITVEASQATGLRVNAGKAGRHVLSPGEKVTYRAVRGADGKDLQWEEYPPLTLRTVAYSVVFHATQFRSEALQEADILANCAVILSQLAVLIS